MLLKATVLRDLKGQNLPPASREGGTLPDAGFIDNPTEERVLLFFPAQPMGQHKHCVQKRRYNNIRVVT